MQNPRSVAHPKRKLPIALLRRGFAPNVERPFTSDHFDENSKAYMTNKAIWPIMPS
jgi:hypothetical protein